MTHPTALIDPRAKVPASCSVGPYCVVGADVELGEPCELMPHVVIHGPTKIGSHNRFFPFCAIGGEPQDVSYSGEKTRLEIGDHNVIREYVTISRGTSKGGGVTKVGSHVLIMAYAHIGHDCSVGDHVIMANAATLAGHVIVEEWASVGAFSAVHQFDRVGAHAYIGGGTIVTQDVLPFSKFVSPPEARTTRVNTIRFGRPGFGTERIRKVHHTFRVQFHSKL